MLRRRVTAVFPCAARTLSVNGGAAVLVSECCRDYASMASKSTGTTDCTSAEEKSDLKSSTATVDAEKKQTAPMYPPVPPGGLSVKEKYLGPFFPTTQETWLKNECALYRTKPLVVIVPRGWRKSMTARRVAARPWCSWWRPITYLTSATFPDWIEYEKKMNYAKAAQKKYLYNSLFRKLAAIGLVSAALFLNKAHRTEKQWTRDSLWKAMTVPSLDSLPYYLLALFVLSTFRHIVKIFQLTRRRTLVFDDVTDHNVPNCANHHQCPRQYVQQNVLRALSLCELRYNVIVVSSNEGLRWAFSDTVRSVKQMPHANPSELLEAVRRLKLPKGPLLADDLKDAAKLLPGEYAYSTRFWSDVAEFSSSEQGMKGFVDSLRKGNVSDRGLLWKIALNLDLECEPTFPLLALGCSRIVKFSNLKNLFPDPEAEGAVERATKLMRTDEAPRRLALAIMLVATADFTDTDEQTCLMNLRSALPPFPDKRRPTEASTFHKYIRPLKGVWIQQRGVDGKGSGRPWFIEDAAGSTVGKFLRSLSLEEAHEPWVLGAKKATLFAHGSEEPLASSALVHATAEEECYLLQVDREEGNVYV